VAFLTTTIDGYLVDKLFDCLEFLIGSNEFHVDVPKEVVSSFCDVTRRLVFTTEFRSLDSINRAKSIWWLFLPIACWNEHSTPSLSPSLQTVHQPR
jgi:hypothetical protein